MASKAYMPSRPSPLAIGVAAITSALCAAGAQAESPFSGLQRLQVDAAQRWVEAYERGSNRSLIGLEKSGIRAAVPLKRNLNNCYDWRATDVAVVTPEQGVSQLIEQKDFRQIDFAHARGAIVPHNLASISRKWDHNIMDIAVEATCGCDGSIVERWHVYEEPLTRKVVGAQYAGSKHTPVAAGVTCGSGDRPRTSEKVFSFIHRDLYRWIDRPNEKSLRRTLFGSDTTSYVADVALRYEAWLEEHPQVSETLDMLSDLPDGKEDLAAEFIHRAGGLDQLSAWLEQNPLFHASLMGIEYKPPQEDGSDIQQEAVTSEQLDDILWKTFPERVYQVVDDVREKYTGNYAALNMTDVLQSPTGRYFNLTQDGWTHKYEGQVAVWPAPAASEGFFMKITKVPKQYCLSLIRDRYDDYHQWQINGAPLLNREVAGKLCNLRQNDLFILIK